MSWRTSRAVLTCRNVGRALGLNRVLATVLGSGKYEDRFQIAMLEAVRQADVVWDVGANVGFYTKRFSQAVGPYGRVFAYEPSPENVARLRDAVALLGNVTIVPVALGEHEGQVALQQGNDPLGATSRIADGVVGGGEPGVKVQLFRGDHLVAAGDAAIPNVVKIDTEGFELEVLRGFGEALTHASLRTVCIEVHFGLLEERGLPNASADIEKLLASSGFDVTWPDASHIVANRIA